MTRAEFIAQYGASEGVEKTRWGLWLKRPQGFERKKYALPCHCGEDGCLGWAMVFEEALGDHLERDYHPDGEEE